MRRTLNEVINYNYYKLLCESLGVSEELQPIAYNMAILIKLYIDDKKLIEIFTNYNWDFNKKTFVKSDNMCKESVFIKLQNEVDDKNAAAQVNNRLEHIKEGKITILLSLIKNYNKQLNDLAFIIVHELLHIKLMYIHPTKDLLSLNKQNSYNYKEDDAIHTCRDILYLLSKSELSAVYQLIYLYVYNNHNVTIKNMFTDKEIRKLLDVTGFKYYCLLIIMYANIYPDIYLKFGLHLKLYHNYKNTKLTKNYLYNKNDKDNLLIFNDIIKFLENRYQKFYNKSYNVAYKAILERD